MCELRHVRSVATCVSAIRWFYDCMIDRLCLCFRSAVQLLAPWSARALSKLTAMSTPLQKLAADAQASADDVSEMMGDFMSGLDESLVAHIPEFVRYTPVHR